MMMALMLAADDVGLATLGIVFSQLMGWVATVCTTIASTPLLLLPVGVFIAFSVIAIAKSFIGR